MISLMTLKNEYFLNWLIIKNYHNKQLCLNNRTHILIRNKPTIDFESSQRPIPNFAIKICKKTLKLSGTSYSSDQQKHHSIWPPERIANLDDAICIIRHDGIKCRVQRAPKRESRLNKNFDRRPS